MPIYEYGCVKCGKTHEIMQKISDAPMKVCPHCGGEVRKLISNTSFVLKGTGWYATDYAAPRKVDEKKSVKEPEGKKTENKKTENKKTENKKTEPASEAKPEPKQEEVTAK